MSEIRIKWPFVNDDLEMEEKELVIRGECPKFHPQGAVGIGIGKEDYRIAVMVEGDQIQMIIDYLQEYLNNAHN